MSNRKNRTRRGLRRLQPARRLVPLFEAVESRLVLSATGFLQGTVYVDNNGNDQFDPVTGDTPLAGAAVELFQNNSLVTSVMTGTDGSYLFTGLAPGTYQVVEKPPTADANEGSQADSPLNPVTATTSNSITVQVEDLSNISVDANLIYEYSSLEPGVVSLNYSTEGGVTFQRQIPLIGQIPITVTYPGGTTSQFTSYCVNLSQPLNYGNDIMSAGAQPLGSALVPATNAGAIGYLYDQYGALAAQPPANLNQAYELQALQLAIWKLIYDTGSNLTTFNSGNVNTVSIDTAYNGQESVENDPSVTDLENKALAYIQEGLNYSEPAIELLASSGSNGYQSLLAPGSLNFSNVPKASPAVTTQASETAGGVVGAAVLSDSATLSGGDDPTGSITFTLTQPDGTTIQAGTVDFSGDGTYASPAFAATEVGTYTWHAAYSGDGLNNPASDQGGSAEQVQVVAASPSLTTAASATAGGVVGQALLTDSATLSGGVDPTGSITFTLTQPDGTTIQAGTVDFSGDGTYASPAFAATEVGTYTWHAAYSGDALNNAASDQGGSAEQVITVLASPTIATTAGDSGPYAANLVPLDGATLLTDSALVRGGDDPTGMITFTLTGPGGMAITSATQTVPVSGDGTYTTPNGYLPTAAGSYTWHATYNGDSLNNGASDDGSNEGETVVAVTCCATNISYTVTTPDGQSTVVTDLRGNTQQSDTVSATFTVPAGDYDQLSLVSYNAPESWYNAEDADLQTVSQSVTGIYGPGTHTISVMLPCNFYQVDFVCGTVITQLGLNSNDFYSAQDRLWSADNGGVNPQGLCQPITVSGIAFCDQNDNGVYNSGEGGVAGATVTLTGTDAFGNSFTYKTTTGSNGSYAFGGLPQSDSSGYTVSIAVPSGDYASKAAVGTAGGSLLSSGEGVKGIVLGNGTITGSGYNFGVIQPDDTISGVVYEDGNNNGTFGAGDLGIAGETVTLTGSNFLGTKVSVSVQTGANGSYTFSNLLPGAYTVTATPLGGFTATKDTVGSVNGTTDGRSTCSTGIGSITLGGSCLAGTGYNFGETGSCVSADEAATIGFWNNKNGQALIDAFNGGGSSTALGDWLASTLPQLFGDLAYQTNGTVAAYFQTLFKVQGQKTYAQIMAGALGVYATDSDLGGTVSKSYGFIVGSNGLGSMTYNVGSNGSALGLSNNTSYSIYDLLVVIDQSANSNGVLSTAAANAANSIFSGINQSGDIS